MELYQRIMADETRPYASQTVKLVMDMLKMYPRDGVCISFNGGKDCTVLFHLVRAALAGLSDDRTYDDLPIVYFKVGP